MAIPSSLHMLSLKIFYILDGFRKFSDQVLNDGYRHHQYRQIVVAASFRLILGLENTLLRKTYTTGYKRSIDYARL